ncbi:DEP domain-containing protein 7-like [Cololabis saira]|uniref:DEP domain-containing protein 7-like n=1 Tax=Cololabis saira TaxID=129043 RepID=UPI002AD4E7B3|nr:DEP domain-containing protein 7-like [Cololabis saira]
MSSIKERAAALNLAEKLCVRPPAPGASPKPVRSSSMWSSLVSHFRVSVPVKRRLVHLKSYSNCFLGSEAVDVLTKHVTHAKGFEGASVSRDKVVCVCQALLECNLFEPVETKVFGKSKKCGVFQDSKSALYRFVGECTPSVDDLERGMLANGIQKLFCIAAPDRLEEHLHPTGSHDLSTPVKVLETPGKASLREPRFTADMHLEPVTDRLSPCRAQIDSALPQSLVDEVWQEQTLLRLLSLVDLPVLEGVLQCRLSPTSPPPANLMSHGNPDLIYTSNHLDRQILKAIRNSQEDEWLCAALDCLDFLPDQPVVELSRELPHCFPQDGERCDQNPVGSSSSQDGGKNSVNCIIKNILICPAAGPIRDEQTAFSQSGLVQCKLLLYGTLVKHYSNTNKRPLLPQHMTDVYRGITDLLVSAKLDKTLEALQLCLKLLPQNSREELCKLLTFMSLAADPKGIKVDKETDNRLAVKKSFSRAILHSKALSRDKEDLLLVFMLSNIKDIFTIPGALHKGVSEKLASLALAEHPAATGSPLSQQMSSKTNADSTNKTTHQELWALLNTIHLDTKVTDKERKRRLRQFYQAHPQIFNQYFGDSAVSWL